MEGKKERGQTYGRDRGEHAREEKEKKEGVRNGKGRGRHRGKRWRGEA